MCQLQVYRLLFVIYFYVIYFDGGRVSARVLRVLRGDKYQCACPIDDDLATITMSLISISISYLRKRCPMPVVLLYLYCSDVIVYILIGEKQYSMVMDLLCSALVVDKDE